MSTSKKLSIDSPIGRRQTDSEGPPVGVVRLDASKSYPGAGVLLQTYINEGKPEAWDEIRKKIDYTFESLDSALEPGSRRSHAPYTL